jgi:hypothetical protein
MELTTYIDAIPIEKRIEDHAQTAYAAMTEALDSRKVAPADRLKVWATISQLVAERLIYLTK